MKKTFALFLIICMLLCGVENIALAEEVTVGVELNGVRLEFDVPPQIINGRTMVPVRKIFESLGAEVNWDGETRTVTAKTEERIVVMQIDNTVISVNSTEIVLDVPPMIVNDRTLVPVRAASEGLGAVVQWRDETKTVIITTQDEKDVFAGFEERLKTTEKTRMGDEFYNWSINIPQNLPLSVLTADGVYFEFSTQSMNEIVSLHVIDAGEATIENIKQSELDYVYDGNATLILQNVATTPDGVQYVRTVYEYFNYWERFRGDSRMFLKDGYIYSLYTRCNAHVKTDVEYYQSIADSFSFSFDNGNTEPLQRIENGFRWYSDETYKVGFNVPADWRITKLDNQMVALSDSLETAESLGMIGFSVFSVTEGESLEEYAKKNKDAYKKLYETAGYAHDQSDITEIDIDGNAGLYYTDEINLPDLKIYRKDMYFYLGDYVYNFQVQFKNADASITDSVIDSFVAIEIDGNEIGYITPQPAG